MSECFLLIEGVGYPSGAGAFQHEVDGFYVEGVGDGEMGNLQLFEAVYFVAFLTVEVGVHVVDGAVAVAVADFVFGDAAAVFEGMDDVVLVEEGEHPQDAGALEGVEDGLDVDEAQRRLRREQGAEHE